MQVAGCATYTPASIVALRALNLPASTVAEDVPLILPSALTEAQQCAGCIPGLLVIESVMRDAQCRTALVRLRNQLHIKTRFLIYKKHQSRHQGMNTRSKMIVARNESKIRLHSEKYQTAWKAKLSLVGGVEEAVGWNKLWRGDIRCMEDKEELSRKEEKRKKATERRLRREAQLRAEGEWPLIADPEEEEEGGSDPGDEDVFTKGGESTREVSWIWTVAGTSGTDEELEDGVFYFHAKKL
ncbi:hypothetical protein DFH09DRAFT_917981 [Mycena vulgaris]|nr:hypothetical protein DFH09DRAFT_917981 [Mycena vulgaris]